MGGAARCFDHAEPIAMIADRVGDKFPRRRTSRCRPRWSTPSRRYQRHRDTDRRRIAYRVHDQHAWRFDSFKVDCLMTAAQPQPRAEPLRGVAARRPDRSVGAWRRGRGAGHQFEEKSGQLRHLQLRATSRAEMKGTLAHAVAQGQELVTIVSLCLKLATRGGLRQNRIVRRRFDALCAYLDAVGTCSRPRLSPI